MNNKRIKSILFGCITLMFVTACMASQNTTSRIDDNELGMGILFDMVNIFLGDVVHTKRISESFLNLSAIYEGGEFHREQVDNWREWMKYLIGFCVCAAIGIIFLVVMPVIGIFFCCCRLCGRCGAKPGKSLSKRAKCKRRSFCTILTILNTVALAGIVCAFICNSLIYKHLLNDNDGGTIGNVKHSLQQIESFINNSVNGYSNYALQKYDTTSSQILNRVNDSAFDAVAKVLDDLHASQLLDDATEISKEANETKQKLDIISALLSELSTNSSELKNNLTQIKDDISQVCNSGTNCSGFDPSNYNTQADFSSLDKLSNESKNIASTLNMDNYIKQAETALQNAKEEAKNQVNDKTDVVSKAIKDVRSEIKSKTDNFLEEKDKLMEHFPEIYDHMDDTNKEVIKYSEYAFYAGIGICCAYLLIIVLYYIGLLFGICGEKPGDGAPFCNTGCGANFLMSGVAFTFIFTWILMIVCVVLFCVSGPVYTEVCRYFQGHDPSQFKDFDDLIKNVFDNIYDDKEPPNLSVVNAIQKCQKNEALFSAFQLDSFSDFDLDKALDIKQLESKLSELKTSQIDVQNISIINDNLRDSLTNLSNSGLETVDFSKYFNELSKQLTVGDLSQMALFVDNEANRHSGADKDTLTRCAAQLRELNSKTLPAIKKGVSQLNETLVDLQQKSQLSNKIKKLINDLLSAEEDFNTNKTRRIKDEIIRLANDIIQFTNDTVNTVKREIRYDLHRCQDVSTALFTMSDAVCLQIVEPVNGMWFSFGWCLFFFVPCLIFAVLLVGQYRRTLEDDKDFDDQNYLMYGGPNPDTIPLTSVDRSHGNNAYPRSGMSNAGYRDENRRAPYANPPPYDDHMRSGIAAGAPAKANPASYGSGYVASGNTKGYFSYPY